ncbi:hypothetical protein hrd7_03830 [Leptolinea sp. HRD-7]|nr:hypothetical protein hrd7_03830 [Leptolinea sp. HRD-7]
MDAPIKWLLSGKGYIQYRTRVDLLGEDETTPDVVQARRSMLSQPEILELIQSLHDWPGKVLSSHKSANQSFHTLNFLSDIGLKTTDPGMEEVVERIFSQASEEGPFRLPMNIGTDHGGTGQDTAGWALCDAPNQVYALARLGLGDDPRVEKAANYLISLVRDNGWPCAVSRELGSFRGPGSKNAPCPYANLAMLKMLSTRKEWRDHSAASIGIQTILHLWEARRDEHPFIFYMGTDFCKLKAPLIWYDILHVLDVLSHFPQAVTTPAFAEMLGVVTAKATVDGTFIPEAIYMPYKKWDFGQKKEPSRWITLLVHRILLRVENLKAGEK